MKLFHLCVKESLNTASNQIKLNKDASNLYFIKVHSVGLGGHGVTCSHRDPRFAGSNSAEVDGFFRT